MDIREDTKKGLVFINGLAIMAFVDEEICKKCHKNKLYSYDYDAFFCIHCDEWLEKPCQDPSCNHCSKRPFKPSILLETPENPDDPKFMSNNEPARREEKQLESDFMKTMSDEVLEIS